MKIVEKDGKSVVKFEKPAVAVICYEKDQEGVISSVGIVKENNSFFKNGYSENLIMGAIEEEDTSLLHRAMIELKEKSGLQIDDHTKWAFLGEILTSKISPDPIYLFSVEITGQIPQPLTGENKAQFNLSPVQSVIQNGDAVTISAFFRLFMKIYKKDFNPSTI
jgi:hypothetical protein